MMRAILFFMLFCQVTPSFAQGGSFLYGYEASSIEKYDTNDYTRRYPYIRGYSPSFLGLIAGYGFLKPQEVELGLAFNLSSGLIKYGMTGGYQMVYRRAIERKQNAVDLEMGVYGIVSMGIGVNYNFSTDGSAFGFKPFIGTSIYHFQLLYGYNFIRKQKRDWYDLPKHSLTLRYVIPLKASKETEYYPRPLPNYRNLQGLNKNHPLKNEPYRGGYEYSEWNEFEY